MSTNDILLTADGVSKRFGSTQALSHVSASFRAGEIHALMGENGAGKSTLGKVIAGLHKQDAGTVEIDGETLVPGSIDAAYDAGVRIVHQELAQCPNLSVAENLCLHDMPRRGPFVDRHEMAERAAGLVHRLEPSIDVEAPLGRLSPGHRQMCQIAASIDEQSARGPARVIVFDEPTSSLAAAEVERLLDVVRRLAADGITVIYVSHRMGEIFAVCDRVTVLRDGKFVATSVVSEIDEPTLVEQMIGRRLAPVEGVKRTPGGEAGALRALAGEVDEHAVPDADAPVRLRVEGLSSPGRLHNVSLTVKKGEVVGVGGLVGAGRSELLDAIFGLDRRATGHIEVDATPMPLGRVRAMIDAGVGYVPEDRRYQGLFFDLGVGENILSAHMAGLSRAGWRDLRAEATTVRERIARFHIKTASTDALPGSLSGGNQQKLLLARWVEERSAVLLLDEPTRGIDVGTKAEIYRLIREAAAGGAAILIVSSEMPELLALSDRVVVLADGRATGELTGDEMTQSRILTLATRGH